MEWLGGWIVVVVVLYDFCLLRASKVFVEVDGLGTKLRRA